MSSAPRISPTDLKPKRSGDVLLGEDWVSPDATVEQFRKGLEALRRNGTFDRLQRKWQ